VSLGFPAKRAKNLLFHILKMPAAEDPPSPQHPAANENAHAFRKTEQQDDLPRDRLAIASRSPPREKSPIAREL
jgi:hypothetical protein